MLAQQKVIIVGAGPSGLMLAAQLLRFGIQPLIIDSKTSLSKPSKAFVLNAKTLEIYQQMGVAQQALSDGQKVVFLNLNQNGKAIATLPFGDFGMGKTQFPFLHILEQNKNEHLLSNYLTTNCCPIYWDTHLVNIAQNPDDITVTVNHRGNTQNWHCTYLIGADGSQSILRKLLNIEFKGANYQHKFYLADVKLANFNAQTGANFYFSTKDFVAVFPLKIENTFRFIGKIPKHLANKKNATFVDVQPHIQNVLGKSFDIEKCNWFATYQLQHKIALSFSRNNCFLIGDAAHIHSPVGGQGMNTGLHDAYNLGWKLAGVLNQQLKREILDSYADERMPVAKKLLKTTDRIFTFLTSQNGLIIFIRNRFLKHLIKWLLRNKKLSSKFFATVSQTGITYRNCKINLHLSTAAKIKAGDRVPYLPLFDEKIKKQTNLHHWCTGTSFILLVLGYVTPPNLFSLAKWVKINYNLTFYYLPPTPANQNIFDAFEIIKGERKMLVIRPDMHIGLISDVVDTAILANYLGNVLGMIK